MSIHRTYDFLRQHIFIRNMKKAVESYVNANIQSTTGFSPWYLLYGHESRLPISGTCQPESHAFSFVESRKRLWAEAADCIALAQARMKQYYDIGRHVPVFKDKAYLRLSKKSESGYHLQNQTKLSFNKISPFNIVKPIGKLAYEIQLPDWLSGIHPVISIEHLEPYQQEDNY
jgi:hypothetical protein